MKNSEMTGSRKGVIQPGMTTPALCDELENMMMIIRNIRNSIMPCIKGEKLADQSRKQIEIQLSRLRQIIDSVIA